MVFKVPQLKLGEKIYNWGNVKNREYHDKDDLEMDQCAKESMGITMGEKGPAKGNVADTVSGLECMVMRCLTSGGVQRGWDIEGARYFTQTEYSSKQKWHTHLLIGGPGFQKKTGKADQKVLASKWKEILVRAWEDQGRDRAYLRAAVDKMDNSDFVDLLTYKHKGTKEKYTQMVEMGQMIAFYFLEKGPTVDGCDGYFFARDNSGYIDMMDQAQREVLKLYMQEQYNKQKDPEDIDDAMMAAAAAEVEVTKPKEVKKQEHKSAKFHSYKDLVTMCVDKQIYTVEDLMLEEPDVYLDFMLKQGGQQQLERALQIGVKKAARVWPWEHIMKTHRGTQGKAEETKTWKILSNNGYNPEEVLHAMSAVLNGEMGKRNTIVFCGPASTGKSIIVESLMRRVGLYGCLNHSNENFPFSDFGDKRVIWGEEITNLGQNVDMWKCVMSGQEVRVDQKGKGSVVLKKTPVVMTSNGDIEIVQQRAMIVHKHAEPIKVRCVRVKLEIRLDEDHGLIDEGEWDTLFAYLLSRGHKPDQISVKKEWGREDWWNCKAKIASKQVEKVAVAEPEPEIKKRRLTAPDNLLFDLELDSEEEEEILIPDTQDYNQGKYRVWRETQACSQASSTVEEQSSPTFGTEEVEQTEYKESPLPERG